jgi:hypothetical protein
MSCLNAVIYLLAWLSTELPSSVVAAGSNLRDDAVSHARPTFELDVQPILVAAGCSTGACHGKARGQNGFQLSLLCFDADFDYAAITKEARGRRVFPAAPQQSLLLQKPAAEVPHGGGRRLEPGGRDYETIRRWIELGMPRRGPDDPELDRITVQPAEQIMAPANDLELVVTAHYTDGSTRDVTALTTYQSSEAAIVSVDNAGRVKSGRLAGESAIMARYMGEIAVSNIAIPQAKPIPHEVYERLPRYNFIDGLVWDKLERLGITPSTAASDSTFMRRAYIDVIGRLPTTEEVRSFIGSAADGSELPGSAISSPERRMQLIDQLLERPEYADRWANLWADLLRPNPYRVGIKAVRSLDSWLRDAFRQNMPYDQMVRELVTAQGSTWRNGAATLFRDRREPEELTTIVSQLFLGVRLECAKCHHHPFEVWGQDDFYSFAAFFSRVGRKGTGISPPISGGEEMVYTAASGSVRHPLTGQILAPRPLGGESLSQFVSNDTPAPEAGRRQEGGGRRRSRSGAPSTDPENDPRVALADWMVAPDNPYFAKVVVNRVWTDLMGRGLVEPVDDLRGTNPPSNGPLLDALADEFRRQGYDFKQLLRTIMSSYVYGLSSEPHEYNVADTRHYSRHYRQRLRAEVLLDAVSDVTGVPESFQAMPSGSRAMELWTVRGESLFLDSFGRPDPNQDPPCERTSDTTVVQALHLMNSPRLHSKITSDSGVAARLAASERSDAEIVQELYLAAYARFPTQEELKVGVGLFGDAAGNRRRAAEDLLWALLNTPEFWFKD